MGAAPREWMLRPDLEVVRTEADDGRPTLLVHDPVAGSFDRVEWPESELVGLLAQATTIDRLRADFMRRNALKPTREDVAAYVAELARRGWLRDSRFWPAKFRDKRRGGRLLRVFAGLLFIQIPLLRPERFLMTTCGAVRVLLLNPLTRILLLLCGAAGLYLALPRWEEYWSDSLGGFTLASAPAFLAALVVVKTAHEFSHAYAATLAGARVAAIGVAFFFLMPLPFTDVTDAWRLSWSGRLRVAMAGMAAEMALAGVALLLWALSPPGEAAMALARLSSVAMLSTLVTNLNPGPRFDGYYVLVCLLRVENLRARGVNALRGLIWRPFFGIPLPDDIAGIGAARRRGALLYAAYAVFYRISLGVGLVLMAYYTLPKTFAVPVAAGWAWLFFVGPAVAEGVRLARSWRQMRLTAGLVFLLLVFGALGTWFFGSWPRRAHFPGVARSTVEEGVRTRRGGVLAEVRGRRGMRVEAGQVLARLESPMDRPLLRRAEWAVREAELSGEQSWRDDTARRESSAREAESRRRRVELDALRKRTEYLEVSAPVAGVLDAWDGDALEPGVSLSGGMLLGRVMDGPVTVVSCYPDLETAGRMDVGMRARFFADSGDPDIAGTIVRMEKSRPEVLEDGALADVLGAVRSGGTLLLSKPYAKVVVALDSPAPRNGQTGRVWVWTSPESPADAAWRWLKALAVRESAF